MLFFTAKIFHEDDIANCSIDTVIFIKSLYSKNKVVTFAKLDEVIFWLSHLLSNIIYRERYKFISQLIIELCKFIIYYTVLHFEKLSEKHGHF